MPLCLVTPHHEKGSRGLGVSSGSSSVLAKPQVDTGRCYNPIFKIIRFEDEEDSWIKCKRSRKSLM